MRDKESKREREKKMVSEMIALYCKKKHHTKKRRIAQRGALPGMSGTVRVCVRAQ